MKKRWVAGCFAAVALGCAAGGAPPGAVAEVDASAGAQVDASTGGAGDAGTSSNEGGSSSYDPFASQPDESEGLTNVSSDLNAVLENGALATACADYEAQRDAGTVDRHTMLLCGKWRFFYDTFGTSGMPGALVQFLATNFPNELGLGFSRIGMIPDPTSKTNMPLGVTPSVPLNGTVPAVAFTCAGCHFGQLADGRYAIGAPNLRFDYATYILGLTLVPSIGAGLDRTEQA